MTLVFQTSLTPSGLEAGMVRLPSKTTRTTKPKLRLSAAVGNWNAEPSGGGEGGEAASGKHTPVCGATVLPGECCLRGQSKAGSREHWAGGGGKYTKMQDSTWKEEVPLLAAGGGLKI